MSDTATESHVGEPTGSGASTIDDRAGGGVAWLFGTTALVGAALLFMVQPMVAKLVLPSYGGSATVWSTSSLFFQVLLLGGYVYTHLATTRLSHRIQPRIHLLVLAIPLLTLPVALPASAAPDAETSPALWLLRTLCLMIGLPFLVVSTTGPLLQRWYSWTDSRRADDPYFLFAASNLGSFGGLLAYPFLIEPNLTLDQQRWTWSSGFVLFAVLMAVCGVVAGRRRATPADLEAGEAAIGSEPVRWREMGYWAALAFLPSTLMLAVTAHLSTDVAPIPLLWVVPLAIYLATFVLAFSRSSRTPPLQVTRWAVALAVLAVVLIPGTGSLPILLVVGVNLSMLALVGYAAHARLAVARPDPSHLTLFYLVIAIGGALGGVLNGLLAPVIFDRVWEYPLAVMAVPFLLVGIQSSPQDWFTRRFHPAFVGCLLAVVPVVVYLLAGVGISLGGPLAVAAITVAVLVLGWLLARHPRALAGSLALAFAAYAALDAGETIERTRTFFGSYSVEEADGQRRLVHGNTVHGVQYLDARRTEPTAYYQADGPLGDVFGAREFARVGVIGLGTGGISAWGSTGQTMKFYEIDPEIVDIAQDDSLFTYLRDSKATIEVAEGDGRLLMEDEERGSFDLIILDAFNSDSIPIHLLTREAMRIYAERLSPDGLLVVHISNRLFDLEPVLAAASADLEWDGALGQSKKSWWAALSPEDALIAGLLEDEKWHALDLDDQVRWTDDYSSILDVLKH